MDVRRQRPPRRGVDRARRPSTSTERRARRPRSSPTSSRSVPVAERRARRDPPARPHQGLPACAPLRRSSSSTSTAPPVALRRRSRAGMTRVSLTTSRSPGPTQRRQVGHRAVVGRGVRAGVDQQAGRVAGLDRHLGDGGRRAGRSRASEVLGHDGRVRRRGARPARPGPSRRAGGRRAGWPARRRRRRWRGCRPPVRPACGPRGGRRRRGTRSRNHEKSSPPPLWTVGTSATSGRCGCAAALHHRHRPRVVDDRRGADEVVELPGGAERLGDARR